MPSQLVITLDYIFNVITIFLFFLYILVLYILLKHRKTDFKSTFFFLVTVLGCFDLFRAAVYVVTYVVPRHWLYDLYNSNKHWMAFFGTASFTYTTQAGRVFNILLALNRMTALAWPLKQQMLWSPEKRTKIITTSIIVSFVLNAHWFYLISHNIHYVPFELGPNTTGLLPFSFPPLIGYKRWAATRAVLAAITIVIFIVAYSVAFVCAYKASKNSIAVQGDAELRTEIKLALGMFVLALLQIANGVYSLMTFVDPVRMISDRHLYYIGLDVIMQSDALANPVLLLAMSTDVKKQFKKTFGKKEQQQESTTAKGTKNILVAEANI